MNEFQVAWPKVAAAGSVVCSLWAIQYTTVPTGKPIASATSATSPSTIGTAIHPSGARPGDRGGALRVELRLGTIPSTASTSSAKHTSGTDSAAAALLSNWNSVKISVVKV